MNKETTNQIWIMSTVTKRLPLCACPQRPPGNWQGGLLCLMHIECHAGEGGGENKKGEKSSELTHSLRFTADMRLLLEAALVAAVLAQTARSAATGKKPEVKVEEEIKDRRVKVERRGDEVIREVKTKIVDRVEEKLEGGDDPKKDKKDKIWGRDPRKDEAGKDDEKKKKGKKSSAKEDPLMRPISQVEWTQEKEPNLQKKLRKGPNGRAIAFRKAD